MFSESTMALALENPSFYQYWEIPLFEEKEANRLRSTFEEYRKETDKWSSEGVEHLWGWIEI